MVSANLKEMRLLTTTTRKRVEEMIHRLSIGEAVSLQERVQLQKYAIHIPFIAEKLQKALSLQRRMT